MLLGSIIRSGEIVTYDAFALVWLMLCGLDRPTAQYLADEIHYSINIMQSVPCGVHSTF